MKQDECLKIGGSALQVGTLICVSRAKAGSNDMLCSYQKQIEDLLAGNPDFIKPESRRNEVMGWVKSGLKDFSLSRAKNEWGIRVPWDSSQTFYVWTDALMGYMTGWCCHQSQTC